jgi:hypothetical protein
VADAWVDNNAVVHVQTLAPSSGWVTFHVSNAQARQLSPA